MQRLLNLLKGTPVLLLVLVELLLVATIGYVDYLIGDYSLLIFYSFPIALAALSQGDWGAIIISGASGYARYLSDDYSYCASNARNWSSLEDMLFFLIVGLLISAVKRLLDQEIRETADKVDPFL
jgi:hypothetical protein